MIQPTHGEKINIVRRFSSLHFDNKSIRFVSKTIKDYSYAKVGGLPKKKTREVRLKIKRGSSQLSTASKPAWQTARNSIIDTSCFMELMTGRDRKDDQENAYYSSVAKLPKPFFQEQSPPVQTVSPLVEMVQISYKSYGQTTKCKISNIIRITLIDWLMELSEELYLSKDILYTAVYFIDRVMAVKPQPRSRYQLLGVACLSLSTKLYLQQGPKFHTFQEALDGSCSKWDLIDMEEQVLTTLKWKMAPPTLFHFTMLTLQLLKYFKEKEYTCWPDLLHEDNYQTLRQLLTYLDLLLLNGDSQDYQKHKIVLALLYVFLKTNREPMTTKNGGSRFYTEFERFCESVGTSTHSLKQEIEHVVPLMKFGRCQPAPRAATRYVHDLLIKRCHMRKIRLQSYHGGMKTHFIGN